MRELETIYQEMRAAFAEKAGFEPTEGCDAAVRLYALAAQVQALEAESDWALRQSFPQTAEGAYLDMHAACRGLARTAAVCAEGTLRFFTSGTAEAALRVPEGTVCMTANGTRFVTLAPAVIAAGTGSGDAPARAVEPGVRGNVSAGEITLLSALPVGVVRCGNPEAFSGGSEAEDDASLRARLLESYLRLPNGANAAYYEQEAMRFGGVASAAAVGRARGLGTVDVYIASEDGAPGEALIEQVAEALEERRELAVDVKVLAAAVQTVDVTAALTVGEGYSFSEVKPRAEAAVRACLGGGQMGKSVRTAKLIAALCGVDGVENVRLNAPGGDVTVSATGVAVAGTITLTEEA